MLALALAALAADPFGLGVAWSGTIDALAARPTTVHDAAGLRAAVARGGYVRLAAGTYRLSGKPLAVNSKTVLEGAGEDATILEVGAQYGESLKPKEGEYEIGLYGSDIGLRRMTIRNRNATGTLNGVVRGHWGFNRNERIFLDSVRFLTGNGMPVTLARPIDALVRNCRFVSTSATQGALGLDGGVRFRFEDNAVQYRAGRTVFALMTDSTFAHNEFRVAGPDRDTGKVETGGVELTGAHNVDFEHNRVVHVGLWKPEANGGEMVMTQATLPEWQGAGRVVEAAGATLQTDLDWGGDPWLSPRYAPTRRKAVYLLTGQGAGQWRWATPTGAGRLRVDRPWDTPPEPGDRISVGSVMAYRLRVRDNEVEGGSVGIMLYDGGLDCGISGNTLRNTGGIVLRASSGTSERTARSNEEHWPLWDCTATGNTVRQDRGDGLATITVIDVDRTDTALPLAIHDVAVTGNSIVGQNGTDLVAGMPWVDGIQVLSENQGGNHRRRPERQAGIVVRDNALTRAAERLPSTVERGG